MAENINYKEVLDDKFVDTEDLKTTSESNEYLTEFNSQIKSSNIEKLSTIDKYYDPNRPGAKSPLSVEAAQALINKVTENVINALRAEIARAISSELRLSNFMKDNMVTKSEDQTITGDKELTGHTRISDAEITGEVVNQSNVTNANIATEAVTQSTIEDLNVTGRLNIPLIRPSNPRIGDIWYE